jgi:hypothetical protein
MKIRFAWAIPTDDNVPAWLFATKAAAQRVADRLGDTPVRTMVVGKPRHPSVTGVDPLC